jgi:hypothetical protein
LYEQTGFRIFVREQAKSAPFNRNFFKTFYRTLETKKNRILRVKPADIAGFALPLTTNIAPQPMSGHCLMQSNTIKDSGYKKLLNIPGIKTETRSTGLSEYNTQEHREKGHCIVAQ